MTLSRGAGLQRQVVDVLQQVAKRSILPRWRHLRADDVSEKSPGDLVTIVDRESEAALTQALGALLPGARVVGEEAVASSPHLLDGLDEGLVWLVDPLDGTGNFVAGSPHFAVMVALVDHGETLAGWIYQPAHDCLYHAERGAGAFCNDRPIRARGTGKEGRVGAFPTRHAAPEHQALIDAKKASTGTALPGLLCAGVDYTRCIDGTQDFAMFWRSLPWDHAPGALILTEAGGWAGWHDGVPYRVTDQRAGLIARADGLAGL